MKEITNKFYVRIENEQYDIQVSEDIDRKHFDEVGKIVERALDDKGALSYNNDEGDRIIVPYKILKKSIIKLIKI